MSDDALQAAFLKMMGKAAPVKWETVDMAKRQRELRLDTHFPVELWPSSAATRKLATKFKTASRGDPSFNPCVWCDLKEFLPPCFPEHQVVHLEERADGTADNRDSGKTAQQSRRLEVAAWMAAWDRFALAATVIGFMSFDVAMMHKANVIEVLALVSVRVTCCSACAGVQIAANANAEGRRPLLGVLYDEVARKCWDDKSGKLGGTFNIRVEAGCVKEELLR